METNNKTTLLKFGDEIIFSKQGGVDYALVPGMCYTVEIDRMTDAVKFKENSTIELPEKLYVLPEDEKFMNRVLKHYENNVSITGVMLEGTKGSGKTVMAKQIAVKSNLPILILDNSIRPYYLKSIFDKIRNLEMCVIIDEFDKLGEDYDDNQMLQVFDGIFSSGKKLILTTCNDIDNVNDYMKDRCGRIRYCRTFEEMGPAMISEVLKDRLNDKTKITSLTDFISKEFGLISFDNVASFAEEVNNYPDESYESLFKDMNISSK